MEELTIGEIAERNMQGEELNSMWYLRAIETAICALSKCPSACDELLYQLGQAYEGVEDEFKAQKKICAEKKDNVPSLKVMETLVPAILEELHAKAPKLKAEDLLAAIIRGSEKVGMLVAIETPENNLSDRAGRTGGNE